MKYTGFLGKIIGGNKWFASISSASSMGISSQKQSINGEIRQIKEFPVIGKWSFKKQFSVIFGGIVFFVATSIAIYQNYSARSLEYNNQIMLLAEVELILQKFQENLLVSTTGNVAALRSVKTDLAVLDEKITQILGIDALLAKEYQNQLSEKWTNLKMITGELLKAEEYVHSLSLTAKQIETFSNAFVSIMDQNREIVKEKGYDDANLAIWADIQFRLMRISKHANMFNSYDEKQWRTAMVKIEEDNYKLIELWQEMIGAGEGPSTDLILLDSNTFAIYETNIVKLGYLKGKFEESLRPNNIKEIPSLVSSILNDAIGLRAVYASYKSESDSFHLLPMLINIWTFLLFFLFSFLWNRRTRLQALEAQFENEQTTQAMYAMMDDLDEISKGNLKHRATVVEASIGTLSDSINQAIEDLAVLVADVKKITTQTEFVTSRAKESTERLVNLTKSQSEMVIGGGQQILHLSAAVNEVSYQVEESAKMATQTLQASTDGGVLVLDVQSKMSDIQERAEEAAKRVSRLTESSKEIRGIVTMMTEMAEQTSVLAVNASVQASRAGEAGRGFKVVAEGVQALSEKSGESARRVESLVTAAIEDIDATNHSIAKTMEATNHAVEVSNKAQEAFARINENVEKMVSVLKDISTQTSKQTKVASYLSENTEGSLKMTDETTIQTKITLDSIREVQQAVKVLSDSVKGFKV